MDTAEQLATTGGGLTSKLLRTPMFPLDYGGLAEGGNTQWDTIALPFQPGYDYRISAPKPDLHLGYPRGAKSPWSKGQTNVINRARTQPYTQPARGNTMPSIAFEVKSEPAGGALTTAEAQAAGSGSHCVNAMTWLLTRAREAGLSAVDLMQDTVSFQFVLSHRMTVALHHLVESRGAEHRCLPDRIFPIL